MKRILTIVLTLLMIFTLTACGEKSSSGGGSTAKPDNTEKKSGSSSKTYAFPVADYVPSGIEYKGSGEFVFTEYDNKELEDRSMCTYVDGATLEDVLKYIDTLKENGLTYAAFAEESLEIDEFGKMVWYGVNSDKSFSIHVNFFDEQQEMGMASSKEGVYKYNLQIQVANCDIYS